MELLVAIRTKRDLIVRCVSTSFAGFQMVDMELDVLPAFSAAAACLAIPVENILADIVMPQHFAFLVIFARRYRFAFLNCFQHLQVKFRCFYHHFGNRQNPADLLDGGDMLLDLDFYGRR